MLHLTVSNSEYLRWSLGCILWLKNPGNGASTNCMYVRMLSFSTSLSSTSSSSSFSSLSESELSLDEEELESDSAATAVSIFRLRADLLNYRMKAVTVPVCLLNIIDKLQDILKQLNQLFFWYHYF